METVALRPSSLARASPPDSRLWDFQRAFAAIQGPKAATVKEAASDSPFGPRIMRRPKARAAETKDGGAEVSASEGFPGGTKKDSEGEDAATRSIVGESHLALEFSREEELPAKVVCAECSLDGAEDVLLLNCRHLLCLGCAAKVSLREAREEAASLPGVLKCPKCQQKTALQEDALEILCGIYPNEALAEKRRSNFEAALADAAGLSDSDPTCVQTLLERLSGVRRGKAVSALDDRPSLQPRRESPEKPREKRGDRAAPTQEVLALLAETEKPLLPLSLLSPPYRDARPARQSGAFVCSVCTTREGALFCRKCIRAFCEECAVETHLPKKAGRLPTAAGTLKTHKFTLIKNSAPNVTQKATASALTNLPRAATAVVPGASHLHSSSTAENFLDLEEAIARLKGPVHSRAAALLGVEGGDPENAGGDGVPERALRRADPRVLSFVQAALASRPPPKRVVENIACEEHPALPVQFFCRTCECHCICAECGIEGAHALHSLVGVGPAWEAASADVEGRLLPLIEKHVGEVEAFEALLQERRLEWAVRLREDSELLALNNAHSKQRLQTKKENVADEMRCFVERFCRQCDGFMALIAEKLKVFERAAAQVSAGKGALSPELVFEFLQTKFDETQELLDAGIPQQFEHLPLSRAALLENFAAVATDLRKQTGVFGSRLREKPFADRTVSDLKGILF